MRVGGVISDIGQDGQWQVLLTLRGRDIRRFVKATARLAPSKVLTTADGRSVMTFVWGDASPDITGSVQLTGLTEFQAMEVQDALQPLK
jgi:hypothetical protein